MWLCPCIVAFSTSFWLLRFPIVGSIIEVHYVLASFGITADMFPIDADGECDLEPHINWMEMRRQMDDRFENGDPGELERSGTGRDEGSNVSYQGDDNSALSSPLPFGWVVPCPQDVLLGGLKLTLTQLGNANFRRLVEDNRDDYERSASKLEKVKISKKIVSEIKAGGARFLRQTDYKYGKDGKIVKKEKGATPRIGWVEVPDHVARERVSHAFRNLRARKYFKSSDATGANESELISRTAKGSNAMAVVGGDGDGESSGCMWVSSSGAFGACMSGGRPPSASANRLIA